ncbi:MAG: hypothetical protein HKP40_01435 [Litoreibacter sp.]|nr:hypothetical protein [Litoreibacter sp.]
MNIKSDINTKRAAEADIETDRDKSACLVSYVVIGAYAFPVIFLLALALGSGFLKSLTIALLLAAPVTAAVLIGMRFVFGR